MDTPLAQWTGEALGEGITTSPLYAREQPDINSRSVTLWQKDDLLILWYKFDEWYLVSNLRHTSEIGWSSATYIRRIR